MQFQMLVFLFFGFLMVPLTSFQIKVAEQIGVLKRRLEDNSEILYQVITELNWTSINFYTDNITDGRNEVMNMLTKDGIFHVNMVSRLDIEHLRSLSHRGLLSEDTERVHVIFCWLDCVQRITQLINEGTTGKFLFMSKWLIMMDVSPSVVITGNLENVAFIYPKSSKSGTTNPSTDMATLDTKWGDRRLIPVRYNGLCRKGFNRQRKLDKQTVFPNINQGLNGRTLRIGVEEWYPYLLKQRLDNGTEVFKGLSVDILEEMGKVMNFRIRYIELSVKSDVWSKLFRMLQNKELDILGCPLMISYERAQTMDLTYPVGFNKIHAYYRRPKEGDGRWRIIVDILSWPVIVVTLLSMLFTATVLGTFSSVYNERVVSLRQPKSNNFVITVGGMIWLLMGNLLKQGQYIGHHKAMSTRMLFAAWSVFCIILTVTFSANLVPALGVNKQPAFFRNLRDLINQWDYKWGLFGAENLILKYLQISEEEDHRELYNKLIQFNKSDSEVLSDQVDVHERKVLTENYVYINSDDATHLFYSNNCDVDFIHEKVNVLPVSFALPKNSPFTDLISQCIMDFYENGQLDHWNTKWFAKRRCYTEKTKSTLLGLLDTQGVFIIVFLGIVSSLLVFLLESFHSRLSRIKKEGNKTEKSAQCAKLKCQK